MIRTGPDDAPGGDNLLSTKVWASKLISQTFGRPSFESSLSKNEIIEQCTKKLKKAIDEKDEEGIISSLALLGSLKSSIPFPILNNLLIRRNKLSDIAACIQSMAIERGIECRAGILELYDSYTRDVRHEDLLLIASCINKETPSNIAQKWYDIAVHNDDPIATVILAENEVNVLTTPIDLAKKWLTSPCPDIFYTGVVIITKCIENDGGETWRSLGIWAVEKMINILNEPKNMKNNLGTIKVSLKSLACLGSSDYLLQMEITKGVISTTLKILEKCPIIRCEACCLLEILLYSTASDVDIPSVIAFMIPLLVPTSPLCVRLNALSVIKAGMSRLNSPLFTRGDATLSVRDSRILLDLLLRGICAPQSVLRILSHSILRSIALPSRPIVRDILAVLLPIGIPLGCVWARLVAMHCINPQEESFVEACEALGGLANAALNASQTERWTVIALLCDAVVAFEGDIATLRDGGRGWELVEGMIKALIIPLLKSNLSAPCCALLANIVACDEVERLSDEREALSPLTPSAPVLRDSCSWSSVIRGILETVCVELETREGISTDGLIDVIVNVLLWAKNHERSILLEVKRGTIKKLCDQCILSTHESKSTCTCNSALRALTILNENPETRKLFKGVIEEVELEKIKCERCSYWVTKLYDD